MRLFSCVCALFSVETGGRKHGGADSDEDEL